MTYPAAQGAMLTVQRPVEITYAARDYKIFVDGVKADSVSVRSYIDIPIPAGRHVVKAKIDWCSSPEFVIEAAPGQRVLLEVRADGLFYEKMFNQVFRPGRFLALNPLQG
ncbi:hypothetical protein [Actinoplanes sp. HUAS TT8]|uniref:hypothetical protein n=1 Tax=Actinoplanes sp. HUAS TT8 TaxID=3447453 RepID=UPI003F51D23F